MRLKKYVCTWICMCLLLVGCAQPKEYKEVEITYEQFQEKLANKDSFVVEIYRENCPYCEKVARYVEETKQEHPNNVLYRLDCTGWGFNPNEDGIGLISDTEIGQDFLEQYPGFYYTPTFYAYKNGEAVVSAIGFNENTGRVSLWEVDDSIIIFEQAETQDYWEFISQHQK